MMNLPTAFVIAVAICAGAFLYQSPGFASLNGVMGAVAISPLGYNEKYNFVHASGSKVRTCALAREGVFCGEWR